MPAGDVSVLLVDDNESFRTGLAKLLRADGYTVCDFGRPADVPAPERLGPLSVAIMDYAMPEQNGLAFADELHRKLPTLPIVMLTAYWSWHLASEVSTRAFLRLRRKPPDYGELECMIRELAAVDLTPPAQAARPPRGS